MGTLVIMSKWKTGDSPKINFGKDQEIRTWARKFGVSGEELKKASEKAGPSSQAVRNELGRTKPIRKVGGE